MLHVDKFQDLRVVALLLQKLRPQAVRQKGRYPLLQKAVFQHGGQRLVSKLPVQLMLAARHRQDHPGVPLHRLVKRVIGGRIAGVESHHHVHLAAALIAGDISLQEGQLVIAVSARQFPAAADHVLFQIQADNPHVKPTALPQIIIHGKGQIGLAAAKIQDRKLPILWQRGNDIFDKFQEPVNLAELVVAGVHHAPLRRHDAQIHQKGNRPPLLQKIRLLSIMLQICLLYTAGAGFAGPGLRLSGRGGFGFSFLLHRHMSLFAYQGVHGSLRGRKLQLAEGILHPAQDPGDRLLLPQVFMKGLGSPENLRLKFQLSLQEHRADPDLLLLQPFPRAAQNKLFQVFIHICFKQFF